MKLLRAGGMLPSVGSVTPATPVSPSSPLHRPRLFGALKALPLVRRFYYPAVASPLAQVSAAAPKSTQSAPSPRSPPAQESKSAPTQTSIGAVLRTGVVMEEGGVGDAAGFTTPVAGSSVAVDVRGRDRKGFPTPARGDGYAPDSEGSSETTSGFNASVVMGESGFTTPAQGGEVDGFKTPV